jgi:predicted DCC family thiol-disulfide oxidoreductase YuxK
MIDGMSTLTLFYDGLCPLCAREMDHYRRCAAGLPGIVFVDITDPSFDPAAHGLDPVRVNREMHVKEGDTLHIGVDAFLAIWRHVPGHRWLLSLSRLPLADQLMHVGYYLFALVRPYLPRRKACDAGACSR